PGRSTEPELADPPAVDIYEADNGLVLEADLPGVAESSLHVVLEDNVLTIAGEVRFPQVPASARPIRLESRAGRFQRSFILSGEVDGSRIQAELKAGVLTIRLPRAEPGRRRRIEVKTG
ncbi:MAG TPA: Hsp20/alpha crystallin family protein, partial [Isosphaeraceae bacterium]|nr:Hsp20/alpha crystallin family protein [Isosphaeraceae bacterium]